MKKALILHKFNWPFPNNISINIKTNNVNYIRAYLNYAKKICLSKVFSTFSIVLNNKTNIMKPMC